jgi:predicted nucleic acid-binding protein
MELANVHLITAYYNWNLIYADSDDDKFVDCAVASAADYLVSEDTHFNVLATVEFPRIHVIGLSEFIDLIQD